MCEVSFEDGFKAKLQPIDAVHFTRALRCILPFEDPLTIDPIWLPSFESLARREAEVNKLALADLIAFIKQHGTATIQTGAGKARRTP